MSLGTRLTGKRKNVPGMCLVNTSDSLKVVNLMKQKLSLCSIEFSIKHKNKKVENFFLWFHYLLNFFEQH